MKAQIESSGSNAYLGAVRSGKVQKAKAVHKKDADNAVEIKAYLNKLQEMVPFMPKHKKLSKVEVISYVIEYIRELRQSLGLPPCHSEIEDIEMEAMMLGHFAHKAPEPTHTLGVTVTVINKDSGSDIMNSPVQHRQPLGVISSPSNTNVISSPVQQDEISEQNSKL